MAVENLATQVARASAILEYSMLLTYFSLNIPVLVPEELKF